MELQIQILSSYYGTEDTVLVILLNYIELLKNHILKLD
jgi:hypothetical protein